MRGRSAQAAGSLQPLPRAISAPLSPASKFRFPETETAPSRDWFSRSLSRARDRRERCRVGGARTHSSSRSRIERRDAFCHAAASSRSAAAIQASAQVASSRAVRAVRQSNDGSAAAAVSRAKVRTATAAPAERRWHAAIRYFFSSSSRCLTSRSSYFLLLGDPVGIAVPILGARQRSGLLDELPDVVARDGDALFEFGKRRRRAVGHRVSPVLDGLRQF